MATSRLTIYEPLSRRNFLVDNSSEAGKYMWVLACERPFRSVDFLCYHGLLVDMQGRSLIDPHNLTYMVRVNFNLQKQHSFYNFWENGRPWHSSKNFKTLLRNVIYFSQLSMIFCITSTPLTDDTTDWRFRTDTPRLWVLFSKLWCFLNIGSNKGFTPNPCSAKGINLHNFQTIWVHTYDFCPVYCGANHPDIHPLYSTKLGLAFLLLGFFNAFLTIDGQRH